MRILQLALSTVVPLNAVAFVSGAGCFNEKETQTADTTEPDNNNT